MELTIKRGPDDDQGNIGIATVDDGGPEFSKIELPWRANEPGKSSIPIGSYQAHVRKSPHFGILVYCLDFVAGRTNIEIHPGNWGGDTDLGWYSDLLGCIALGYGTGILQPPEPSYKPQKAILRTRAAFADFMARTKNEPLTVTIVAFDSPYR
jgi:hypothetical protein